MLRRHLFGALGACLIAVPAAAHVTLENREAPVGAGYKAVLRVPHGCEGTATTALRVRIPEGVIGVKPMPKPGWTLTTVTGKYAKTYELFHAKLSEGVTEIAWSGGKLPDAQYDEFVFQGESRRRSSSRQDDLLPGGAGMREGRASLDRDSRRGQGPGRLSAARARPEAAAEALDRACTGSSPH